jgi:rubrerythrin
MKTIFRFLLLVVVAGVFAHCNTSKPKKAVENLKAAFNNEATASAKYAKYAQAATSEGFDTIAKLFDAVSKSESIHALNYGKVLEKYGTSAGNPEIGSYEVKSTAENLQTAITSETSEIQKMYPGFIRNAENEKAPEAAKSFTWAWDAEKKHLNYYKLAASAIVKGNEAGLSCVWYVCPTCGNTYNPTDVKANCDFCLTKQENFIGYTEEGE